MSSHLVDIFEAFRKQVVDIIPETLDVHHCDLRDPLYLGPELARDIEGATQSHETFLNALILSPLTPEASSADAAAISQDWLYRMDLYFIYRRGPGLSLRDVVQKWGDPLHDILNQYQLRRLAGLNRMKNTAGKVAAYVTGFKVAGPPDFYRETENGALYPLDMACFAIPLEIELAVQLDPETRRIA